MRQTWNTLSPQLAARGFCVFALNYGDMSGGLSPLKAVGGIAASARELDRFVEKARRATGARRVDLVGYSQGGLLARQYLRFEGGAPRVHALVALAPSNRGTKTIAAEAVARFGLSTWVVRQVCPACADQLWSSDLVRALNREPMALPGIDYTVVSTTRDGVVVPYESQQLPPGPRVTNVTLQEVCPGNRATHLSIPRDTVALGWVRHALDPRHTPPPACR
jgi:pimeloyl-ACP methyl ester carboxylesterase